MTFLSAGIGAEVEVVDPAEYRPHWRAQTPSHHAIYTMGMSPRGPAMGVPPSPHCKMSWPVMNLQDRCCVGATVVSASPAPELA